ncbi:hypothetical protein BGZ76_000387 [Entomortierella beljakovae]|nr:hypothetical protein BGZ76_000387 [Entomortierella beljakovae]
MGFDLTAEWYREMIFREGGPGVIMTEVLYKEADPRALFSLRPFVRSDIAIAKGALTQDKVILSRIFSIWGTTKSDLGSRISLSLKFGFGIDNIASFLGHDKNQYYAEVGEIEKMDMTLDDPYKMVTCVTHLNRSSFEALEEISTPQTMLQIAAGLGYVDWIQKIIDGQTTSMDFSCIGLLAPLEIAVNVSHRYSKERIHFLALSRVKNISELDLFPQSGFSNLNRFILTEDTDAILMWMESEPRYILTRIVDLKKEHMIGILLRDGAGESFKRALIEVFGHNAMLRWPEYLTVGSILAAYNSSARPSDNACKILLRYNLYNPNWTSRIMNSSIFRALVQSGVEYADIAIRYCTHVEVESPQDLIWFWNKFEFDGIPTFDDEYEWANPVFLDIFNIYYREKELTWNTSEVRNYEPSVMAKVDAAICARAWFGEYE